MFWVFFNSVSTLWMNRFHLIVMSWSFFLNPEKYLEYLKEPSEMFAKPKPKTNKAKIHYNQMVRYVIWDLFLILLSCSREVHCTRMLYLIPKISHNPFPSLSQQLWIQLWREFSETACFTCWVLNERKKKHFS